MKVSVILPVYNSASFLEEAIKSILGQSFSDFEFLIIDDGSTDKSAALIQNFKDNRIKVIRHASNLGLISSLNEGLSLAKGEYIARMDADDISSPERFLSQVNFLNQNQDVGVVGTAYCEIDENGKKGGRVFFGSTDGILKWHLLFRNPLPHPSIMARRELLNSVSGYKEEALHTEDYDLWVRLAEMTKFACLSKTLLFYRKHSGAVTWQKQSEMILRTQKIARLAREKILSLQSEDELLNCYVTGEPPFSLTQSLSEILRARQIYLSRNSLTSERFRIDADIFRRTFKLGLRKFVRPSQKAAH